MPQSVLEVLFEFPKAVHLSHMAYTWPAYGLVFTRARWYTYNMKLTQDRFASVSKQPEEWCIATFLSCGVRVAKLCIPSAYRHSQAPTMT